MTCFYAEIIGKIVLRLPPGVYSKQQFHEPVIVSGGHYIFDGCTFYGLDRDEVYMSLGTAGVVVVESDSALHELYNVNPCLMIKSRPRPLFINNGANVEMTDCTIIDTCFL